MLGAAGGVGIVCENLSKKGWDVVGSGRTEDLFKLSVLKLTISKFYQWTQEMMLR